ncbi:hypothetical protein ANCCAN_25434 [Ancylostoma caninum]|uniref:Uncharacterized protein n=1 Tax=Ancylostoma caninum TaxID=29170 RepID=A0A368FF75_ANCCA|nr:hypothetical protein ANCCAN_25434 [Ancylostoma caninum]
MPSMTATMVPFLHVARTSKRRRDSLDTQEECCLDDINENTETDAARISREMKTTVEAIAYIAEHMKAEMSDKKVRRIRANR